MVEQEKVSVYDMASFEILLTYRQPMLQKFVDLSRYGDFVAYKYEKATLAPNNETYQSYVVVKAVSNPDATAFSIRVKYDTTPVFSPDDERIIALRRDFETFAYYNVATGTQLSDVEDDWSDMSTAQNTYGEAIAPYYPEYANSLFVFTPDNHLAKQLYMENTAAHGWNAGSIGDIGGDGTFLHVSGGASSPDVMRVCKPNGTQSGAMTTIEFSSVEQFNPDGTEIWVGGWGRFQIFNAATTKKIQDEYLPVVVKEFIFSPNQSVLGIGTLIDYDRPTQPPDLIFLNMMNLKELVRIPTLSMVNVVVVNADQTLLVAALQDSTLQVWGIPAD